MALYFDNVTDKGVSSFKKSVQTNLYTLTALFQTLMDYYCTQPDKDMRRIHYRVEAELLLKTARDNIEVTKQVLCPFSHNVMISSSCVALRRRDVGIAILEE